MKSQLNWLQEKSVKMNIGVKAIVTLGDKQSQLINTEHCLELVLNGIHYDISSNLDVYMVLDSLYPNELDKAIEFLERGNTVN